MTEIHFRPSRGYTSFAINACCPKNELKLRLIRKVASDKRFYRREADDDGRIKITSARTEQLRKTTDNLEINSVLIDRNDSEDRIKQREEEKRGNADGRRMAVAASRDGNRTR